jgi:gamma-glutamyl hercynylcysteine S-oxide synthase
VDTQTTPRGGAESLLEARLCDLLTEARERTLQLVEGVSEEDMDRVHHPLMSPLVWDLGHIAAFEDLWLCGRAGGLEPLRPDLAVVYDAAETPRADRADVPYLRLDGALDYMEAVRARALGVLDRVDMADPADALNHQGLVWDMLVQHEQQHNETMLQTLMLAAEGVYRPGRRPPVERNVPTRELEGMVLVGGGPFPMGLDASPGRFSYDNERPRHEIDLAAFEIDCLPVTNGRFAEFVADGGYSRREWWSEEGWAWRVDEEVQRPLYWTADGEARSFERTAPIDPDLPVMYVSWYEADAFARWCEKRLPTEAEWEKAACWDAVRQEKRRYPWGDQPPAPEHANLDQLGFGPDRAGAYPDGASPCGALGMIGDAWEWTASPFTGYPRFRAFPYREYSEVFFGEGYRVLRGGSWATRPHTIRGTFRNWDHPQRRQIHAGFRCARDA